MRRLKKKKIVSSILIILLIITSIPVYAGADADIWERGKNWIKTGKVNTDETTIKSDWTAFNDLAGILWGIGIFVVVIGGTILGIKYVFSSVEEKASIKESMKPYIIGSVFILGALTIWKVLVELLGNMQ